MQVVEKMERETGLEPATSSLGSWHSTTELLPLAFIFNDFQNHVFSLNTEQLLYQHLKLINHLQSAFHRRLCISVLIHIEAMS